MKVKKVLCSKALTGFYMDDKEAIKAGAKDFIQKPIDEDLFKQVLENVNG